MRHGWTIESPNDWLRKAGAHIINNRLILPHDFLLVPMGSASEALLEYRRSTTLSEKMRHAMAIALAVRNADTAFYNAVAKMLNKANPNKPNICHNCIRGQLFGTRMKELRQEVNAKIIHKMENPRGIVMISPDELPLVEKYYEEMFKLPLIDPVSWPERKKMELCQKCKKKWRGT